MSRSRLRALYGAGPLNLLVLLLSFVIAGIAVWGWFQRPRDVATVLEWFVAAIVLHDLVVVPLYSLLDRIVFGGLRRPGSGAAAGPGRGRTVLGAVNSTPYLRVPTILSGLLLLVFFPVIFGLGRQTELSASGIPESGYLARWLIASGVMFALSAVALGVAVGRGRLRPGVAAGTALTPPPASAPMPARAEATAASDDVVVAPEEPELRDAQGPPAVEGPPAAEGPPAVEGPPAAEDPSPTDYLAASEDAAPAHPDDTAPRDDAAPPPPPD